MRKVIITSPSLDPNQTLSGISSVAQFIISNNKDVEYIHFEVGKRDGESGRSLNRIMRIIRNCREWSIVLKDNPKTVVHYNMPLMTGAIIRDFMLIRSAHRLGNPVVLHVHGGSYMKQRNRPWYIKMLLCKIFSWSSHVVVLSDIEKEILEEDFGLSKVDVLPNCIDLSFARNFNKEHLADKPISILYIGRIEANKGIDYIYKAVEKLQEDGIDFVLHFAGKEETEGEYIPKFKHCLAERFKYHGVVSGDDKTDLLMSSDVFLLPSFYEGLPMALLETMSFGVVPVITPVGSIPMVVKDKMNGLFIKVKDYNEIVDSLLLLNENPEKLKSLSENARCTIFEMFDDKKYVSYLNSIYIKYDR